VKPWRSCVILAGVLALAASGRAPAQTGEKALANLHGAVTYLAYPDGAEHAVAPAASILLHDDDVAKTGDASMGAIELPDSSRVLLGSDTTIKLDAFDAAGAQAHFVVFNGKLRFRVEHPQGAKADYTFTTPTGTIAVRGTEGDISADPVDGVRVNVYHLSDPSLPVHVTMLDGTQFDVPAGQKLWMRWERGKLVGKVLPLTKAEIQRFSEFGPPTTIDGGAPAR